MKKYKESILEFFLLFFIGNLVVSYIILYHIHFDTVAERTILRRRYNNLEWPPLKVFVYENQSRHTSDCLYPPEMPNRYINKSNYWFQRMLEPTVHIQMLNSPLITNDPEQADLFYIPHYSRMCSGLDNGLRWKEIPEYLSKYGNYLYRYGQVDHFIMHSVPHYGDKPADISVQSARAPMIGLLDFKWAKYIEDPWVFAKSTVMPFITLVSDATATQKRKISVFVAMATSKLAKSSAELRKKIEANLKLIPKSKYIKISRSSYKSFIKALNSLPTMMGNSNLCIIPPGDAPSSKRMYDAISHLCVPLILSDKFTLPYDGTVIDYEKCCLQLPSDRVDELPQFVGNISQAKIEELRNNLVEVKERFTWDYEEPPQPGQALWTLSWALYDKIMMMKPYMNNEMTGFDPDPQSPFGG